MSSPSSASDTLKTAVRLLKVRERSVFEVTEALRRRGFEECQIEAAVDRCRELGYLDDRRFTRQRVRQLLTQGKAVGPRLLADLAARGIDADEAQAALSEAAADVSEEDLLRSLLARRYGGFSYAAADDRQKRRVVHFFLRRGFPLSLVLSILKEER